MDAVAKSADLSKVAATRAVGALFDSIAKVLKSGDALTLVGFGTFRVSARAARKGRNPSTGNPIDIPASNAISFKAGTKLKEAINN
ncbi:MAG: HU family DNA-binding protein [Gammaproteobacteria bacterium]|nr:HU family DNA-binding protein [Gammaproteobacteria bacterium]